MSSMGQDVIVVKMSRVRTHMCMHACALDECI